MTRMTVYVRRSNDYRRRPSSSLCLLAIATVITTGFLGAQIEARRRNPLHESIHKSIHDATNDDRQEEASMHRMLSEKDETETSTETSTSTSTSTLRGGSFSTRDMIGTRVNVTVANSPDDHLVKNLPLLDPSDFPQDHWAGLLPVRDEKDGYLFYWLFAPDPESLAKGKKEGRVKEDESNVPLLIWLNGGPACSSMDGLWIENGPLRLQPDKPSWKNIRVDPNSWHRAPAYTLYIDQPVGTGLSFTTSGNYPRNDQMVNEDFYYFLTEFMKLHSSTLGVAKDASNGNLPTLQRPFFFSGESHAGHYIPSMMNHIRKQNQRRSALKKNGGVVMPLSGAAIGNGWFDPTYQYSAQEAGYGFGIIGKAQKRALDAEEEKCREDIRKERYTSHTCFSLLNKVVENSLGTKNPYTVSQYDQRKREQRGKARTFPPGHIDLEAYLGQTEKVPNAHIEDVLEAIHAGPSWESGQRYRECTDPPYNALAHQDGLGVVPDIVELLEHHERQNEEDPSSVAVAPIKLLFFNGIHDLVCNHVGNENALENMPWKHREDYVAAPRYGWNAPSTGSLGGFAKEFQNLIFLKVLDSGHMVPMDVPEISLDMLVTFLYDSSFDTFEQKVPRNQLPNESGGEDCQTSCPACETANPNSNDGNNNNNAMCTRQQCLQKFQFATDDEDGSMPALYAGILLVGFAVMVLAVVFKCFRAFSIRRRGGGRPSRNNSFAKVSQIELADNGEYRDDDNDIGNGNGGVDNGSFEDEHDD